MNQILFLSVTWTILFFTATVHANNKLEERIEKLEKTLKEFMENWGPEVQKKRAARDDKWDEMVRVLSIQNRNDGELQ